jgi:hypothetical protein
LVLDEFWDLNHYFWSSYELVMNFQSFNPIYKKKKAFIPGHDTCQHVVGWADAVLVQANADVANANISMTSC